MRRTGSAGSPTGLRVTWLWPCVLLGALLAGCASSRREGAPTAGAFNARVIYLIHGDADYVYHDSSGRARRADEDALQQALDVGARTTGAEVFVFHQKSEWVTRVVGKSEGRLYHYRDGTLQSRETYFRNPGNLEAEAGLVRRHAAPAAAVAAGQQMRHIPLVLAYFGHEIPRAVAGNDSSTLNRERFVAGLTDIATAAELAETRIQDSTAGAFFYSLKKPYGLIILSVCNGGTPGMMKALTPLAEYAVASPARLHLSHLDARALGDIARTDSVRARKPWKRLADSVAAQSFARLQEKTLTEITVAVYDLEQTGSFLASAASDEAKVESEGRTSAGTTTWRDCFAEKGLEPKRARRGVTLLYRAPRFGPDKDVMFRSAWQCEASVTARRLPAE
jgi:hypothetical protein